ncbi:MAG: hypothetical protein OEN56_00260 [Gemmatimonadota bacterium]|nr:hypothetical protein [Gemmatimonadota bacterium]
MEADPARSPSFEDLVEGTRGLQPWRRIFHALTGVSVVVGIYLFDIPAGWAALFLGGVVALLLVVDIVRLKYPASNEFFFRCFRALASPREARGIASSTWYVSGMAIVLALFPIDVATSAILVLALADPAGSYTGQRWGRRPLLGGTVLGTAVFFFVAGVILWLRHGPVVALTAGLATTLAERHSWPLDDNLAVPLVAGAVTAGVAALLG